MICTPATKDQSKTLTRQVLKVISVWQSRKFYPDEEIKKLKTELEALAGTEEELKDEDEGIVSNAANRLVVADFTLGESSLDFNQ